MKSLLTIALCLLFGSVVYGQGIQPSYPVGATMTSEQFELNWCVSQHWLSRPQNNNLGFHITFVGKWTDDQKVEFGERCMKYVRSYTYHLHSGGAVTSAFLKRAHAQQKPESKEPKTYILNPDASTLWKQIDEAQAKLREQYNALEGQKVAILIGAGVPKTEWDRPATTENGVVVLKPKVEPKEAAKVKQ